MATSCSAAVSVDFDRALALLHIFWYVRAFERFTQVAKNDPECAVAYWGAAMTYNHPFWDPPSQADEAAAWALVQKGLSAAKASAPEKGGVAALYKDAGAGTKSERDENYRDAMAAVHARYPDDETKLFYGLSILEAIPEGAKGFERQGQAVKLFEEVYARQPDHPGVLHHFIHAYGDPEHAQLVSKRLVRMPGQRPPCLMLCICPRTFFARLGDWEESAATNLRRNVSEDDVKRARESGAYRDFHNLTYLEYAYIQLERYREAQHTVDIIAAQYQALPDKTTALDTPALGSRHVRGRTIYSVPDRVVVISTCSLGCWWDPARGPRPPRFRVSCPPGISRRSSCSGKLRPPRYGRISRRPVPPLRNWSRCPRNRPTSLRQTDHQPAGQRGGSVRG